MKLGKNLGHACNYQAFNDLQRKYLKFKKEKEISLKKSRFNIFNLY